MSLSPPIPDIPQPIEIKRKEMIFVKEYAKPAFKIISLVPKEPLANGNEAAISAPGGWELFSVEE